MPLVITGTLPEGSLILGQWAIPYFNPPLKHTSFKCFKMFSFKCVCVVDTHTHVSAVAHGVQKKVLGSLEFQSVVISLM